MVEDRDRLLEVDLDPRPHGLRLVVLALRKLAAVGLARAGLRRVRALALGADQAAREAVQELIDRYFEVDDPVEALAKVGHQAVQGHSLGNGAREAVHDEAWLAVGPAQAAADDLDHDVVGDVLAGREDGLRLPAKGRAGRDLGAQHVAGGDVRDAEVRAQHVGLGPLATTGGAVQEEVHRAPSPGFAGYFPMNGEEEEPSNTRFI